MKVRLSNSSVSATNKSIQLESIRKIYEAQFQYYQIAHSEENLTTQLLISDSNEKQLTVSELNQINDWLQQLDQIVQQQSIFDTTVFREVLSIVWYKCCQRATVGGLALKKVYDQSPYRDRVISPFLRRTLFMKSFAKQLLRKLNLR